MINYDNRIEISIEVEGEGSTEYYGKRVPRIGEKMDLELEHFKGIFLVKDVTERVFKNKKNGEILSYTSVSLERIEKVES